MSIESLHAKCIAFVVALSDIQPEVKEHHEQDSGDHGKRSVFHFKFEAQQLETFVARPDLHAPRFVFHLIAAASLDLLFIFSVKTAVLKLGIHTTVVIIILCMIIDNVIIYFIHCIVHS